MSEHPPSMWTHVFILLLALIGPAGAESGPGRARITEGACDQLPFAAPPRRAEDVSLPPQAEARPAAIDSVRRILDKATQDKTTRAKQVLATQRPVLFTVERPEAGKLVGDLWVASDDSQPPAGEEPPRRCGNAMVIVAYDDARYGGAFEVLRDCGATTYAETAFWLRYGDFNTLCQCAVELVGAGAATGGKPVSAESAPAPPSGE